MNPVISFSSSTAQILCNFELYSFYINSTIPRIQASIAWCHTSWLASFSLEILLTISYIHKLAGSDGRKWSLDWTHQETHITTQLKLANGLPVTMDAWFVRLLEMWGSREAISADPAVACKEIVLWPEPWCPSCLHGFQFYWNAIITLPK